MSWVFELYREYLENQQKTEKRPNITLEQSFQEATEEGSLKILVQEPWMGTIRFKRLAIHPINSPEILPLYENPMEYLFHRFGGGKFKVNFYRGMSFIATKNFKPQGEPLWRDIPECVED